MTKETKNITQLNFRINQSELKHLKFENKNNEHIVTLVDQQEFEILKGYGNSKIEALNDLHSNLL